MIARIFGRRCLASLAALALAGLLSGCIIVYDDGPPRHYGHGWR